MSKITKEQKMGMYVTKVGYYDIRQKPQLRNGIPVKGQTWDILVYRGKKQVAGPFKSHDAAKIHAEELMSHA